MVAVATLKCFIGASLIVGRPMRVALWLLALEFVGILSPLGLLPARLFSGPTGTKRTLGAPYDRVLQLWCAKPEFVLAPPRLSATPERAGLR